MSSTSTHSLNSGKRSPTEALMVTVKQSTSSTTCTKQIRDLYILLTYARADTSLNASWYQKAFDP